MTFFFIAISNLIVGQSSGSIGIAYDRYTNNFKEYKRTDGITLQLCFEKSMNHVLYLNYGIHVGMAHENYYSYHYRPDKILYPIIYIYHSTRTVLTSKSNNYSINVQFPFIVKTKITDKLFLISGISVNIDNLVLLGDAFPGIDPEVSNLQTPFNYYLNDWPVTRKLGFGHQFGLIYQPTRKLGLYTKWRTNKNNIFSFSYLETGLQIKIFSKNE